MGRQVAAVVRRSSVQRLIVGIMTFVLLRAIYPSGTPSVPTFEAAAFILGTQEARFFNFLAKVGELILSVPENRAGNPDPPAG